MQRGFEPYADYTQHSMASRTRWRWDARSDGTMKKVLLFAFGMLAFLAVLIAQSQVLQNIGGTTTASGSVSGATLWGTNATEYTGTITNVNVGFALGGFHIGAAARLDYPESQVFIGDALGNGSGTL